MILIKGSKTDYITEDGRVFKKNGERLFEKKTYIQDNGYTYCGITFPEGNKNKRVHRLIAEAFIDNPNELLIVGHKNNDKSDNRIENLYWTTVSENTQKAYDDGLAKNSRGAEDSQSKAIIMIKNNIVEIEFGSIREASRETGIPLSTITRRLKSNSSSQYRKYKEYTFKYKE